MIGDLISGNFDWLDLLFLLLRLPIVFIALSFHELAHGYIAERLGDPTARAHGRITMNPVKHFDPLGMLSMVLFGVGWAKPVPINPRNFKNPKKGMAITAAAGPIANLILAFIGALIYRILLAIFIAIGPVKQEILLLQQIVLFFVSMFESMNIYLAVFNLIPVPPFDGSRLVNCIFPDRIYFSMMKYERLIMVAMIVLLFTGIADPVLDFFSGWIMRAFDFVIGLVPFL